MAHHYVSITAVDHLAQRAFCADMFGNEYQIDTSVRPKSGGFPNVGERWVIRRLGNLWALDMIVGVEPNPVLRGSREGLHPVSAQVLDAMRHLGLVYDETAGPLTPYWDDTNDPYDPLDPDLDEEPPPEEDPVDEHPEPDDPGPQEGEHDEDEDPHYAKGKTPFWFGTYNLKVTIGPQRAYQDLVKFGHTKVEVFGTQEMNGAARGVATARFAAGDWNRWRPTEGVIPESQIFWRDSRYQLLDKGAFHLAPAAHTTRGPRPTWGPRVIAWVKLRQRRSGRVFFFASVHPHPHIDGHTNWHFGPMRPGHPSSDPQLRDVMSKQFEMFRNLREWVHEKSKIAPVVVVGDFNLDFYADRRVRDPRFPYAQFRRIDTYCNWDIIKHHTRGTHGNRHIDQLWFARRQHWGLSLKDHWVLGGYTSDHRPVIVKGLLKNHT
jgi:hypothetical protein